MPDWFERTGIILFTEHYEASVAFYADVLGLTVEDKQPSLTRFGFGETYLMVERGGVAATGEKSRAQSPVTLPLNVADFDAAMALLHARGAAPAVQRHEWGTTGHFLDPDGNRIEIRDRFRA